MTLIIMRQKYKGKKMLILYTPQPDHVVTLHRYYTTLKREKSYKKHVSWFSNIPSHLQDRSHIAIVEYMVYLLDKMNHMHMATQSIHHKSMS